MRERHGYTRTVRLRSGSRFEFTLSNRYSEVQNQLVLCSRKKAVLLHRAALGQCEWLYATIPNISNTFDDEDGTVLWEDKPEWTAIESRLENFEPKSFSAAIKAASAFTRKRNQSHQAASSTQPSASPSPQTSPGGTEQSDEHMSDGESSLESSEV